MPVRTRIYVEELSETELAMLQTRQRTCASPACVSTKPTLTYADFDIITERGHRVYRRACHECLLKYGTTRYELAADRFRLGARPHGPRQSRLTEKMPARVRTTGNNTPACVRIARVIMDNGPLDAGAIAAKSGLSRKGVLVALRHPWFELSTGRWSISNSARIAVMEGVEVQEEAESNLHGWQGRRGQASSPHDAKVGA
jgi:hypothetical protein